MAQSGSTAAALFKIVVEVDVCLGDGRIPADIMRSIDEGGGDLSMDSLLEILNAFKGAGISTSRVTLVPRLSDQASEGEEAGPSRPSIQAVVIKGKEIPVIPQVFNILSVLQRLDRFVAIDDLERMARIGTGRGWGAIHAINLYFKRHLGFPELIVPRPSDESAKPFKEYRLAKGVQIEFRLGGERVTPDQDGQVLKIIAGGSKVREFVPMLP